MRVRGARPNNLGNPDLDLPTGKLIVVTGVFGSGKRSLVFETRYAEVMPRPATEGTTPRLRLASKSRSQMQLDRIREPQEIN